MTENLALVARSVRGTWSENLHFGLACVATPDGRLIATLGAPKRSVFLRSAAKPIQLLPLIAAGGLEAYDLSPAEIALMCSSHAGSDLHVEAARQLLARTGVSEQSLACGIHPPLGAAATAVLAERGELPGVLHNNCSANHIGQLLACRSLDLESGGYLDPEHPLQLRVRELIAMFSGLKQGRIQIGIDGCGLPSYRLPVSNAARIYACLADPEGGGIPAALSVSVHTIVEAMAAHPEMVAGPGRFTTELIRRTGGRLIGKEGAEGFYGVAVRGPVALGLAIKIADGSDACRDAVVIEVLRQAGCLSQVEYRELGAFHRTALRNHAGVQTGELVADLELIGVPAVDRFRDPAKPRAVNS